MAFCTFALANILTKNKKVKSHVPYASPSKHYGMSQKTAAAAANVSRVCV